LRRTTASLKYIIAPHVHADDPTLIPRMRL